MYWCTWYMVMLGLRSPSSDCSSARDGRRSWSSACRKVSGGSEESFTCTNQRGARGHVTAALRQSQLTFSTASSCSGDTAAFSSSDTE